MQIAKSFGTTSSDAGFVDYVDFNKDSSINMKDVIILAKNFGNKANDYPNIAVK